MSNFSDDFQKTSGNESKYQKLPISMPVLSWRHGRADAEGSKMFGRWACEVDEYDKFLAALDLPAPQNVEKHPKRERGKVVPGQFYSIYSWRSVIFAPIATRSRWYLNQQTGKKNQHVQTLVHLAEVKNKVVTPTFPAMLSAKVFAAGELLRLLDGWFAAVRSQGVEYAPQYYWMAVGSFGDQPKYEGPQGTTTLPELYLSDKPVKFVGDEVGKKMQEIKAACQLWLNDELWLKGEESAAGKPANNNGHFANDEEPVFDDDIPF